MAKGKGSTCPILSATTGGIAGSRTVRCWPPPTSTTNGLSPGVSGSIAGDGFLDPLLPAGGPGGSCPLASLQAAEDGVDKGVEVVGLA
jgi:hypothetical protein